MGETPVTDLTKFIVFKPVQGGYVYRSPNVWLVGSSPHYLLGEKQKAEILGMIASISTRLLWIIGISALTLSVVLGTSLFVLAGHSNLHGVTEVLLWFALMFSLYAGFLISRQVLLSKLRPILAGLPTTDERITMAEIRAEFGRATPPVVLSPARRRVLRICLILMPLLMIALLISRALDMREATHEPMRQTLYLANADLAGLLILLSLFWVVYVLLRRREWYAKA
jgi:hypothetical protein